MNKCVNNFLLLKKLTFGFLFLIAICIGMSCKKSGGEYKEMILVQSGQKVPIILLTFKLIQI